MTKEYVRERRNTIWISNENSLKIAKLKIENSVAKTWGSVIRHASSMTLALIIALTTGIGAVQHVLPADMYDFGATMELVAAVPASLKHFEQLEIASLLRAFNELKEKALGEEVQQF